MTEAEWLACDDPDRMLAYLAERFRESHRQGRLLVAGCARLAWQALGELDRGAAELNERLAERFEPHHPVAALIHPMLWRQGSPAAQAAMVRDLFGDPFRPAPALDPAWRTHAVLGLAQAAYDDRDHPQGTLWPDRLAVLSDALEEAGCADPDLLGHLRSPGPHVRGCWALDLILGKG
jgi:hypothetical protein